MKARAARPDFDAPAAIMRAAGEWIARHDRGLSVAEAAEFSAWLGADSRHRAAFAQLDHASAIFDKLRQLAPETESPPDPNVFAPRIRASRWCSAVLVAGGLAAAAALAFVLWSPAVSPVADGHYATDAGGYRRVALRDGSVIELNGGSVVDVEFTRAERRARLLRGEAHFQIAKDPAKPFVVFANTVALRVVGTAFNVRLEPSAVEVLVTEGTVQIHRAAQPATRWANNGARLSAGHSVTVPTFTAAPLPTIVPVTPAEIARVLAWQPRVAEFHRTPLADAVAELNRHAAGRFPVIVVGEEDLRALKIGGSFRLDQPEAFVALLESGFGVVAKRDADQIVLRKAR